MFKNNIEKGYNENEALMSAFLKGAIEGVQEKGLLGAFTGGIKAPGGGIAAAIFFGYIASLISKPKMKKQ